MNQDNSLGKEMAQSKNPVIERQKFWYESGLKNQYRKLIEGKLKFLFDGLSCIADYDKSIPPKVWSDFVDGIILFLFNLSGKSEQFSESYIDELTKPGTEEVIKIFKNPKTQKAIIERYQFSTDLISFGEGKQTIIDAESLFKFNQLAKEFVIGEDSLIELRKKFIDKAKKNYGLEGLSKTSTRKEKPSSLTTPETGIVLHYLMEYGSNDYKYTSDKVILADYLVKLKLNPSPSENLKPNYSPSQVYNKGIVLLPSERQKRRGKKGVFTKTNFWNAIQFLVEIDNEAYTAAFTDFFGYSSDEINPSKEEEGISEIFFKK
jgi:hypothetical protein